MNKYFNSTDLLIVPTLANYTFVISGNFSNDDYDFDFDWTDYDNFFWTPDNGTTYPWK